jgi:hypothetical protein
LSAVAVCRKHPTPTFEIEELLDEGEADPYCLSFG